MKNKNKLLIIYFILLAIGIYALISAYYVEEFEGEIYLKVFKTSAMLLIYIVPAILLGIILARNTMAAPNYYSSPS